jgi:predicted dehydrogenase/threonine dehydrogenase-like Zn-dependent dehydrogenase
MKQVVQALRNGEPRVADVPVPVVKPGFVLVRTQASLVSAGTERTLVEFAEKNLLGKARARPDQVRQVLDKARREGILTALSAAWNRLDDVIPLGYSSAGVIAAVGEGQTGFRVGERVACGGGGHAVHAEYVLVPKNLLVRLPDAVPFETGAFATLGAIAMHGLRLSGARLGESVAIIGLGLLGQLAAQLALSGGCRVLGVDLDGWRVDRARELGLQAVRREEAEETARAFTNGIGFDAVLICADAATSDPVELAGAIARDRGTVVAVGAVGMTIPRRVYYEKELSFRVSRSYGPGRYDPLYEEKGIDYPLGHVRWTEARNMEAVVELIAAGKLDVAGLITHRFAIEQAPQAYSLITGKTSEPFLGVVLTYPTSPEGIPEEARRFTLVESSAPVDKNVRLGVLGAGNFGRTVLFPILRAIPSTDLVGVAASGGARAVETARRYGFAYSTTDDMEILKDTRINTVAIVTRHHLHAGQVVEALQQGKHVFCEKPLALNAEELEAIARNLLPTGPLLMVGFNRRFAPLALSIKKFMQGCQEPLVMHYRVNAGYLPREHWLHDPGVGGGRIIGEGCHFIDFLTWLADEPPLRVLARGLPDHERYCEDNVVLHLEFPGGTLGTVTYLANGDRTYAKERMEVFGGGRVAVLDDFRRVETSVGGRRQVQRSWLRQDKGHRGEWEAFVAAVGQGGPPPIPYRHLLGVTRASFAAATSLRTGEWADVGSLTFG